MNDKAVFKTALATPGLSKIRVGQVQGLDQVRGKDQSKEHSKPGANRAPEKLKLAGN